MNYNSVTFSADLSLEPIMDANGPLSLYRRELENNRGNHDNIDLRSSPTTGTNHQGQIPPMNELALFFRTLEWMEIEGAILQSYKELVTPLVVAVRRQRDGQRFLFRRQDLQTIDKVLTEVDTIVAQVMRRTFSEFHFACGVLNSILVTVVFCAYPQHFWLLYLVEGLFLLPCNLYKRIHAKPLNRVFTYLDYCWMANILALVSWIGLALVTPISHDMRQWKDAGRFGTSKCVVYVVCAMRNSIESIHRYIISTMDLLLRWI